MGIKNFFKIVVKNPDSEFHNKMIGAMGEATKLNSLKGKRVGVDASNMIYRAVLAMRTVQALTDESGETTAHINTIFSQILQYRAAGIEQVWIFDSPVAPEIKRAELDKRAERRAKSTSEKVQFKMKTKHVNDIKQLLNYLGILHIEAPEGIEGEQYGAYLTMDRPGKGRFCDYIISGDADVLAFGGNLLRPTTVKSSTGKSRRTVYMAYELDEILEATKLTREELIKCAVSLGTDFAEKVKGVGVKTVITKVKAGKIVFDEDQVKAKRYFMSPVTGTNAKIIQEKPNIPGLIEFLVSKKFNHDRLIGRLEKAKLM